ncbi:MAG: aldose epimerase family protein [Bacillota bacterium]
MSQVTISQKKFGELKDGRKADLYILENKNDFKIEITNYGARIVRLYTPDKNGDLADIVLGYDNLEQYLSDPNYFGAIIGRYSNRIAGAKFELNKQKHHLEINERINGQACCLHGGQDGFDSQLWTAEKVELNGKKSIKLTHLSQAGEGGFPGNLKAVVYYTLTSDNKLRVEYRAETDQPTVVNLTQHSYFNLKGQGNSTIADHLLYLKADKYTPITENLIPTGEIRSVKNSPFDFRNTKKISAGLKSKHKQLELANGYDHNFVLNKTEKELELAARLKERKSGRQLEVWTTEPGIQFYSGNEIILSKKAKNNKNYSSRSGLCLETQHYPNSPNQENFPATVLRPGEKYRTVTEFKFDLIQ